MRYLKIEEVLALYNRIMSTSGGLKGVRDLGALESAVAQPYMSIGGEELYRGLEKKAAVLGGRIIQNHPFLDGNKRVGHAAMEVFLFLNGYEIKASTNKQERIILDVAAGKIDVDGLEIWLKAHLRKK